MVRPVPVNKLRFCRSVVVALHKNRSCTLPRFHLMRRKPLRFLLKRCQDPDSSHNLSRRRDGIILQSDVCLEENNSDVVVSSNLIVDPQFPDSLGLEGFDPVPICI